MQRRVVVLSSEILWRHSLSQRASCYTSLRRSPEDIHRPLYSELLWRLAVTPILTCRTVILRNNVHARTWSVAICTHAQFAAAMRAARTIIMTWAHACARSLGSQMMTKTRLLVFLVCVSSVFVKTFEGDLGQTSVTNIIM